MENNVVQGILNLAELITESDSSRMATAVRESNTLTGIRYVFTDYNIRWTDIVEEDVTRLMAGQQPLYFVRADVYVQRYRHRRGIDYVESRGPSIHDMHSAVAKAREAFHAMRVQVDETLGVPLWGYYCGFACRAEMQEFYASEEWQCKAKVTRYLWRNRCRVCQRSNVELHAHHESPIMSAYHRNARYNFLDDNLWVLCKECHRGFHAKTVRGFGRYYRFTDTAEVQAEKETLRLLQIAHDEIKLCPYCYGYQPDWYERYAHWRPTEA